jgi:dolichol-phosphate mannosyltransferase
VSIVAPCFNEDETIDAFYRRATAAAVAVVAEDFEIVLVDDGSTDRSWQLISELAARDPRVVGVRLRRNYGHQMAVMAGLQAARGDRVLLIDADLQDPPELLADMMKMMDGGAEVVYGKRAERAGETMFKRATAAAFYRVLRALSSVDIPVDSGDFRLMNRRVVDIFLSMPEQHRYTRGLVSWIGGSQVPISYARDPRFAGETKYPLSKMVRFAVDALTSFSIKPLRLATWTGFLTAFGALGLMAYSSVRWAMGEVVDGWTSLIMTVAAFSAVQLIVLGILGEYVGRLVLESKHRPLFVVDAVLRATRPQPVSGEEAAPPADDDKKPR